MYSTPESPKTVKRCVICGEQFEPGYAKQKCCGKACAKIQADKTRSERRAAARTYVCKYCGETYEAKKPDRNQFCCREHGWLYQKEHAIVPAPKPLPKCVVCGNECPSHDVKYCGDDCRKAMARVKAVEYAIKKHVASAQPITCRICGTVFIREYGNKKRYTCSDECQDEMVRRQRSKAKEKYGRTFNRRGREKLKEYYGGDWRQHYERINRERVYKRDGMRCQLCGIKVRRIKTYRDDQASVDHIVPLSIGGDHTYANVQTCCMRCNSEKGISIAGQLRLVG